MYLAGKKFIVSAGTIILLVNLVVWALGYFPHSDATYRAVAQQREVHGWDDATFDQELAAAHLRESYLGRMGRWIEPVVKPMGWDWRIGVAVIASFPAREVVVATMGTIYGLGEGEDESSQSLRNAIQAATWPDTGRPVFTLPVALSIMVFFALCAQCSSTLVTMGRETGTWRWPIVSFLMMTLIAYFAAWGTAAAARAIGG
jgi:ferrous iron transport protein B